MPADALVLENVYLSLVREWAKQINLKVTELSLRNSPIQIVL